MPYIVRTSLLACLLCAACVTNVEDGGACEEDDDCVSGTCHEGFCLGSECSDTETHSDCEPGWECTFIPPSVLDDVGAAIGGLFGGDGRADGYNRCRATCGHCPPTYHCGSRTEGLCEYGAPIPEVTLSQPPLDVVRGELAAFEATVTLERGSIVRFVWAFTNATDGSIVTVETMEPQLSHALEQPGWHTLNLTAHADSGQEGEDRAELYVAAAAGDPCVQSSGCADGLTCDGNTCR